MKKKIFAALAATVMLHGMPAWANESKDYTLDELMQMSLEELETLTDCKGITEKIGKIAANPPLYCENGCISYYILLNEYDKVIPTLWETVTVEDADGRMVDIEQISRDRTAEVLGVPEKALGSIYILSTELNHRGSEVLIETGLEKADVLEVSVNLNAYGEENIYKSYYFATRQLESDDNENILNIERIRLGKSSERPISVEDNDAKELYGLSVDTSTLTLNVGETRELKVSLNPDYYLADSLHFYSDDKSVAWVYPYIGGHVIGTSAGTATIQVSARLDKNKVKLSPEDNGERSVMVKVTVTEPALSESQKAALKKLEEAEQNGWGIYLRERAIITGVLAADAPRLTLDEANRIVDPSQPCEKVWKALMDAQIYPDYYDTGDPTSLVYWLDGSGQEVIGIQDFSMIHYARTDENGILQEVQYLYPEQQEPVHPAETTANAMFRNYHEVYGGPYTPEPVQGKPGDANCDGFCDVADAVLIARFANEDRDAELTDKGKLNADVIFDGNVDMQDAERILQYIAKKISYEEFSANFDPYMVPIDFSVAGLGAPEMP